MELLGDIAEYSSFQDGIWSFWIEGVAVLFISIFGIFGKMDFSLYGIFPSFSFTARVKLIKQNVLRNKASSNMSAMLSYEVKSSNTFTWKYIFPFLHYLSDEGESERNII